MNAKVKKELEPFAAKITRVLELRRDAELVIKEANVLSGNYVMAEDSVQKSQVYEIAIDIVQDCLEAERGGEG